MTSELLPPIQQDPSIVAGQAVKQTFLNQARAIRSNFDLSDLAKARRIVELWNTATAELSRLFEDLQRRRLERLSALQTEVPYGPDIAEGTSAADAAVLHASFRDIVDRARSADGDELEKMFQDAERFGDELAQRAVFTVAVELGRGRLVVAYTEHHAQTAATLAEINQVERALAGAGDERAWVGQALSFGPRSMGTFPQPDEVRLLPQLEELETNRKANRGSLPAGSY